MRQNERDSVESEQGDLQPHSGHPVAVHDILVECICSVASVSGEVITIVITSRLIACAVRARTISTSV